MTLLPHNFDSDILKTMQMFRYNRNGSLEPPPNPDKNIYNDDYIESLQLDDEIIQKPRELKIPDWIPSTRILRSGRKIVTNHIRLPRILNVNTAIWSHLPELEILKYSNRQKPILKISKICPPPTPYATINKIFLDDTWIEKNKKYS